MEYRAFSGYHVGYSHVKRNLACEDYATALQDPRQRYYIAAACDGHSDKNCFRSAQGARFACEAATEILSRFFELYLENGMQQSDLPEGASERLRMSIRECWTAKVEEDLRKNPVREEDLAPLSGEVRDLYLSGRGLQCIYGTTFLATAVCQDLFLVMHIGDGTAIAIAPDGTYYEPLEQDDKGDMGEPASLWNDDLFRREKAFRCAFLQEKPLAVVLSSDGIADSMDPLQFRETACTILTRLAAMEDREAKACELNVAQKKYLDSFVAYWAEEGHGRNDDCSYAGIYRTDVTIPKVRLPQEQARELWKEAIEESQKEELSEEEPAAEEPRKEPLPWGEPAGKEAKETVSKRLRRLIGRIMNKR